MYKERTRAGHKIVKKGWARKTGRYYIIFYREINKDYNIGLNYNEFNGEWGQGVYDFKTQEEAQEWIKKNL